MRDWAEVNGYTDLANVGAGSGDDHPVRSVSWYDVVKWCNAKSQMEGLTPVYQVSGAVYKTGQSIPTVNSAATGYRVPQEKEWEWAARGGVNSQGFTYSGSNNLNLVAWYNGNAEGATHAVGTKSGNELGIFDMSGNVSEWCENLALYLGAQYRQARGGSWWDTSEVCTVSDRVGVIDPAFREYSNVGFRLARNAGN